MCQTSKTTSKKYSTGNLNNSGMLWYAEVYVSISVGKKEPFQVKSQTILREMGILDSKYRRGVGKGPEWLYLTCNCLLQSFAGGIRQD